MVQSRSRHLSHRQLHVLERRVVTRAERAAAPPDRSRRQRRNPVVRLNHDAGQNHTGTGQQAFAEMAAGIAETGQRLSQS